MSLGTRDPPGSASLGLGLITGGHLHAQTFFFEDSGVQTQVLILA